jgi:hypothetical protein
MRTTLLLLALLAGPALASQTVWKWVDESGVTHYSDRPVPGATKMEIAGGNRADSGSSTYSQSSSSAATQPANAGPLYTDFEIWKPGDTETIPNTGGAVDVEIRLQPALQSGHDLYLYMDGRLLEDLPNDTTSFSLTEVPRGQHTLRATIQANGKQLQESPLIRFIVRQESAAQPPVGPSVNPPPKPTPRRTGGNKMPVAQPTYASLTGSGQMQIDPVTNRPVKPVTLPAGPKKGN